MVDPTIGPVVKMTASEDGAALHLYDERPRGTGAVQLNATRERGNFLKVVNKDGHEQTIKP